MSHSGLDSGDPNRTEYDPGTAGEKNGYHGTKSQRFEKRDKNGTITLHSLQQVAKAVEMELVYAIAPKNETLEQIIDKTATVKATQIVARTTRTMELEDQANNQEALERAFEEKKNELKTEIPKFLNSYGIRVSIRSRPDSDRRRRERRAAHPHHLDAG